MPEGLCNIGDWLSALIGGNKNKGGIDGPQITRIIWLEKQRGQKRSADYADGLAGNKG